MTDSLDYDPETFADDFRPVLEQARRAAVAASAGLGFFWDSGRAELAARAAEAPGK